MRPAILVEDVTVRFRPYLDRKPTLRRTLSQMRAREQSEVIALDHITFRIERGEAFGIIGSNGAGKSTLLRVIARTLKPDSGRVVVNGKTSTLLQLGVGFNTQLSGARNVYLGGLAAGLTRKEIDAVYDSIVEFAELGDAIYRPMKTYSSGMFSRLAFSVSMHLDPDVLLLDEVLAVGDQAFKQKSTRVMRDLVDRSGTIVFVSHSVGSVAEFCDRALWLDSGHIRMLGTADEVVDAYIEHTGGKPRRKGARDDDFDREQESRAEEVRMAREAAAEAARAKRQAEKLAEAERRRAERHAEKVAEVERRRAERHAEKVAAARKRRHERRGASADHGEPRSAGRGPYDEASRDGEPTEGVEVPRTDDRRPE